MRLTELVTCNSILRMLGRGAASNLYDIFYKITTWDDAEIMSDKYNYFADSKLIPDFPDVTGVVDWMNLQ